MTTEQLPLFQEAPAPKDTTPRFSASVAPPEPVYGTAFYVGGWRIWRVSNMPFGGGKTTGWRAGKPTDAGFIAGGYCPRVLRGWLAPLSSRLRPDDLPPDLFARGFERDVRPGYEHWIHWPAGSYSACLGTLEANIAACRLMRTSEEFLTQYRAEQAAAARAKQDKRRARRAA